MATPHYPKGSQFQAGDVDAAQHFTLIPGVRSLTMQGMTADDLDATSHDTPGSFRDKIQGLKDWGTVTAEMLWDPANAMHAQMFEDFKDGTERYYRIQVNARGVNLGTFEFKAYVKSNPISVPYDALLTKSIEIVMRAAPEPVWYDAS